MSDSGKYFGRSDIGDGEFWDLSKRSDISRPTQRYPIHKKTSPEPVLIESDTGAPERDMSVRIPEKKVSFSTPDTVIEYTPENIFISKVKITTTDNDKSIFNPSALFMRERAALIERHGTPCDYVSFYAHSPRYSSLTRPQLNYYLWWRENMRRGELIKTDISYIKLYIQEIVTSGEGEDAKGALCDLIKLAKLCFDNPVGKVYISRIISDFCLIHRLECPTQEIRDVMHHFTFEHIADEFFLGLSERNRDIYAPIAIEHISIYNYKKSKFYEGSKELFDKHIPRAMHACFTCDASYRAIAENASGVFSTKLSDRKLFDGRVEFCAPNARILVSYFPVGCIAGVVTDSIRYCENKIRAALGIRTNLAVGELPHQITDVIDNYFASAADEFPRARANAKAATEKAAAQEYERLYDIPASKLSLTNAKEIEARSWETTRKLTEAFENEAAPVDEAVFKTFESDVIDVTAASAENGAERIAPSAEPIPVENNAPDAQAKPKQDSSWGEHYEFLLVCRDSTAAEQKAYARGLDRTVDELADAVNEFAVDAIGDIIVEFNGEKYCIIEDYLHLI